MDGVCRCVCVLLVGGWLVGGLFGCCVVGEKRVTCRGIGLTVVGGGMMWLLFVLMVFEIVRASYVVIVVCCCCSVRCFCCCCLVGGQGTRGASAAITVVGCCFCCCCDCKHQISNITRRPHLLPRQYRPLHLPHHPHLRLMSSLRKHN